MDHFSVNGHVLSPCPSIPSTDIALEELGKRKRMFSIDKTHFFFKKQMIYCIYFWRHFLLWYNTHNIKLTILMTLSVQFSNNMNIHHVMQPSPRSSSRKFLSPPRETLYSLNNNSPLPYCLLRAPNHHYSTFCP